MNNQELLQELAQSAEMMLLEDGLVRLIWDEGQGKGENQRLNSRKKQLKELVDVSENVFKDDGMLHISVSESLLNVEKLKSWVEEL